MEDDQKIQVEKEEMKTEMKKVPSIKIQIDDKRDSVLKKGKKYIWYIISVLFLILILYVAMTIKNSLDDTVNIVKKSGNDICGSDSCIVFDGYYENEFIDWNIRKYWPLFSISINTNITFEEDHKVDIVCPVELKSDSFQYLFTKFSFLLKKDKIKSCDLIANDIS